MLYQSIIDVTITTFMQITLKITIIAIIALMGHYSVNIQIMVGKKNYGDILSYIKLYLKFGFSDTLHDKHLSHTLPLLQDLHLMCNKVPPGFRRTPVSLLDKVELTKGRGG